MTLESSSVSFAYASLVCSLSLWLALILSYFERAVTLNFSGARWLAIQGVGILLAVLNFEKKLWVFSLGLALITFFFVIYVIGS